MIRISLPVVFTAAVCVAAAAFADSGADPRIDPAEVAAAAGIAATPTSIVGSVRIDAPRPGLKVTVGGTKVSPALGLSAQAAFTGTKAATVVIADVPLLEGEVNGFLVRTLDAGFEVSSLHNRFLMDQPRVMSLHFEGAGPAAQIAAAVGKLFRSLGAGTGAVAVASPSKSALDLGVIQKFLWKGTLVGGVYLVSTGRGTELAGVPVGESMGVSSWSAFSGTTASAVVNGDMACLEFELKDVLRALVDAHFAVSSIHTHLLKETPRLMFVHYWGKGKLVDLAKGVRDALYTQKNFRGSQ